MAPSPEDVRKLGIQATLAAEEFSKLYYETFDKRRQAISKIYQDKANLVWNGHIVSSAEAILKFFDNLPQSEHVIEGMDTQPIAAGTITDVVSNSIVVTFLGKVKFKGSDFKAFTQTFMLCSHENKWKIVSDTFRFIE
uniref:NTF2-related export protein n=1 Tax=Arion vulgaris TaxID=1028688 RepID=A0A0B6ZAT0_9EUPU